MQPQQNFNDGAKEKLESLFKDASVSPVGSIPSSIQVIAHFISALYGAEVPFPQQWSQSALQRIDRIM